MKKIAVIGSIVIGSVVLISCQFTSTTPNLGQFLTTTGINTNTAQVELNVQDFNSASNGGAFKPGETMVTATYSGTVAGDCEVFSPDGVTSQPAVSGGNQSLPGIATSTTDGKYLMARVACLASGSSYSGNVQIKFSGAKTTTVALSAVGSTTP